MLVVYLHATGWLKLCLFFIHLVGANMNKMIANPPESKQLVFALVSTT